MARAFQYRLGWRTVQHVCPNLTDAQAREVADALGPAFHEFGINNRLRARMAVAQMAHESDHFRTTTEYADGTAYEWRRDLGNTHPGDGRRFRGRGYIQITGRANYAAVSKALGHDFVAHPEDLAKPAWAAKASCWWWKNHGLNALAMTGSVLLCTRRINGGTNGLADRRTLYRRTRGRGKYLVPKRRKTS